MKADQPKILAGQPSAAGVGKPPGQLASLAWGLLLGAFGGLPALFSTCDSFSLLLWFACLAPAAGAFLGGLGMDPLRFGAVAPAVWAVVLTLWGAAEESASLPTPAWGALAWTGLFFAGMGIGRIARAPLPAAAACLLVSCLLVGLPGRGDLPGRPWSPGAVQVLLDCSPFVLLSECSGVRDLAWHRSVYAAAGTDRFQRSPWDPPWTSAAVLALGAGLALIAVRRERRLQAGAVA